VIGAVKDFLFRAARVSGFSRLVRDSTWRNNRVLVLCYHGISTHDEHEWNPLLFVSQAHFRRRLEILRTEGCHVLTLDEAVALQQARALPPRSVVLTFDDGSATFPYRALPVLQEFGYPAAVYLTTYYCDRHVPVPALAVSYLLWRARERGIASFQGIFGIEGEIPIGSDDDRASAVERVREWMSTRSSDEKNREVEALSLRLGYGEGEFVASRMLQIMSAAEVQKLPANLVQVELHTHRHRAPSDPELFRRELEDNASMIMRLRDREPVHFCYPSGIVRKSMLAVLKDFGISSATTCRTGFFDEASNPLLIPRLTDSMTLSEETFRSWIAGTASMLPRRH